MYVCVGLTVKADNIYVTLEGVKVKSKRAVVRVKGQPVFSSGAVGVAVVDGDSDSDHYQAVEDASTDDVSSGQGVEEVTVTSSTVDDVSSSQPDSPAAKSTPDDAVQPRTPRKRATKEPAGSGGGAAAVSDGAAKKARTGAGGKGRKLIRDDDDDECK